MQPIPDKASIHFQSNVPDSHRTELACVNKPIFHPSALCHWWHLFYFNKRVTLGKWTPGPQDSISHTNEEEETHGHQNRGTAQACYCWRISPLKALLKSFKKVTTSITSMSLEFLCLHAFQLLPFLKGTQIWAFMQVPTEKDTDCIPDHDYLCPTALIIAESFHILIEN